MAKSPIPYSTPSYEPPSGFNLVKCPSKIISKFLHLITNANFNPNNNSYFCYSIVGTRIPVFPHTIIFYFRTPLHPWPRGDCGLHMETPNGEIHPAHVPSILETERFPKMAKIVLNHILMKMDVDGVDDAILPPEWAELLDPEPTLRDYGRIFLLKDKSTMIATLNNVDQYEVLWVSLEMSHLKFEMWIESDNDKNDVKRLMNMCKVKGRICPISPKIPISTDVVVWNVRGANRLGFKDRFKKIVKTRHPSILLLMETRSSRSQFEKIKDGLVGNYSCASDNVGGLNGGNAVLWDRTTITMATEKKQGPIVSIIAEVE